MSNVAAVITAIIFWVGTSLLIGLVGSRLSLKTLRSLSRVSWWLRGPSVRWYRRQLHIEMWKDRLPEAGGFAGGVSKRHLLTRQRSVLERMYLETIRAEIVHAGLLVIEWLPVLWLRFEFRILPLVYAVIANVPFIAVQRYNRLRFSRLVRTRDRWSIDE
jgi:glycosyl-4,4'-diaponeurosporenoate acyltransferase